MKICNLILDEMVVTKSIYGGLDKYRIYLNCLKTVLNFLKTSYYPLKLKNRKINKCKILFKSNNWTKLNWTHIDGVNNFLFMANLNKKRHKSLGNHQTTFFEAELNTWNKQIRGYLTIEELLTSSNPFYTEIGPK